MRRQSSLDGDGVAERDEEGVDTRPWTPVPLSGFGTYTGQRVSNGLQVMHEEADTSAFWEEFEQVELRSEMRNGRQAEVFSAVASAATDEYIARARGVMATTLHRVARGGR
jgi:hypothetical protein